MEKEVDNHLQRSRRRRGRILRKINQCRFSPDANLIFDAPAQIMFVGNFLVMQKLVWYIVLGYILIGLYSGVQCTNWKRPSFLCWKILQKAGFIDKRWAASSCVHTSNVIKSSFNAICTRGHTTHTSDTDAFLHLPTFPVLRGCLHNIPPRNHCEGRKECRSETTFRGG